jgi:hypothetical protein
MLLLAFICLFMLRLIQVPIFARHETSAAAADMGPAVRLKPTSSIGARCYAAATTCLFYSLSAETITS